MKNLTYIGVAKNGIQTAAPRTECECDGSCLLNGGNKTCSGVEKMQQELTKEQRELSDQLVEWDPTMMLSTNYLVKKVNGQNGENEQVKVLQNGYR